MFRLVIAVLAAVGLWSLLSGGAGALAVGLGVLLLPLLFLAKIALFMVLFGVAMRAFGGRGGWCGSRNWAGHSRPSSTARPQTSERDRFEEWHRMQHARDEVDSWVEPTL